MMVKERMLVCFKLMMACCVHAWHTVYTSRAVCGPTGQPQNGAHVVPAKVVPALTQQPCNLTPQTSSFEPQVRLKHEEKVEDKLYTNSFNETTSTLDSCTEDSNYSEECGHNSSPGQQDQVPKQSEIGSIRPKSGMGSGKTKRRSVHFSGCQTETCDKIIKSTTYLETNFEVSKRMCKSISNNNVSFQEVVAQNTQSSLSSRLMESPALNRSRHSASLADIPKANSISSTQYYSERKNVNLLSRSQSLRKADSTSKESAVREVYSSYKDTNAKDKKDGAQDMNNGAQDKKDGAQDLNNGAQKKKDGAQDIKNGAQDKKDGKQAITKDGGQGIRLLRTPSDIFSFYDISREGATTV